MHVLTHDVPSLWWLLLALPLVYFVSVGVTVAVAALYVAWTRRGHIDTMDEHQLRAFGELRRSPWQRARGLVVESLFQGLAFNLQVLHTLRLLRVPRGAASGTPVIVLPGYSENAGSMFWLARRLSRAGFNTFSLEFPSTYSPIEHNARWLGEQIDSIRARLGAQRVVVVAHSMGGLVTRTLIHSREDHGVLALCAIASPFRGTELAVLGARLRMGRSVAQMTPTHEFIAQFPPSLELPVPLLSIVARQETIVVPEWSAVIAGATVHVLDEAYGHVAPLFVGSVFARIEQFLIENGVELCARA